MCNFYAHIQSYDIISEIDVDVSRALVPATVECDVLPSVDVDSSSVGCSRCLVGLLRVLAVNQNCAEFVEYGYCL